MAQLVEALSFTPKGCRFTSSQVVNGGVSSMSPLVTGGSGILKAPTGGECIVESFIDDGILREYPSKVPSPSVTPWKSPIFSSAGGRGGDQI